MREEYEDGSATEDEELLNAGYVQGKETRSSDDEDGEEGQGKFMYAKQRETLEAAFDLMKTYAHQEQQCWSRQRLCDIFNCRGVLRRASELSEEYGPRWWPLCLPQCFNEREFPDIRLPVNGNVQDFCKAYDIIETWHPKRMEAMDHRKMSERLQANLLIGLYCLAIDKADCGVTAEQHGGERKSWISKTCCLQDDSMIEALAEVGQDPDSLAAWCLEKLGQLEITPQDFDMESDTWDREEILNRDGRENLERARVDVLRSVAGLKALIFETDNTITDRPLLIAQGMCERLLFIFVTAQNLVVISAIMAGILTQFFFQLYMKKTHFLEEGNIDPHRWACSVWYIWFGPVFLIIQAMLGEHLVALVVDALDYPPMQQSRAYMYVSFKLISRLGWTLRSDLATYPFSEFHTKTRPSKFFSTEHNIDYIFRIKLWVSIVIGIAINARFYSHYPWWHYQNLITGTVIGGVFWGICVILLIGLCKVHVHLFTVDGDEDENCFMPDDVTTMVVSVLSKYSIVPGTMFFYRTLMDVLLASYEDEHKEWLAHRATISTALEWKRSTFLRKMTILQLESDPQDKVERCERAKCIGIYLFVWLLVVVCIRIGLLHWFIGLFSGGDPLQNINFSVIGSCVWVVILLITKHMHVLFPKLITRAYWCYLLFFTVVLCLLFNSTAFLEESPDIKNGHSNQICPFVKIDDAATSNQSFEHSVSMYPVCNMHWGHKGHRVTVLDLAVLSAYSYAENRSHVESLTNLAFGSEAEVLYVGKMSSLPRIVITRFSDPEDSDSSGTVVISVKGTSTAKDAYADAAMYSMISVLQQFDKSFAVLGPLPNPFIMDMLEFFRLPNNKYMENCYFNELWYQLNQTRNSTPNEFNSKGGNLQVKKGDKFILTGHSLGGGLAQSIGARAGILAVVFSAPGNYFSSLRFNTPLERLYRNVVGIMPDNDLVPKVDRHSDTVQHIQCVGKDGNTPMAHQCHSISRTTCELWRVCGDSQERGLERDFWTHCGYYVDEKCIGKQFGEDDCPGTIYDEYR